MSHCHDETYESLATSPKVLSLSDLKDLPVATVWDVLEQLAERGQEAHPILPPPPHGALPGDVPRKIFHGVQARRKKSLPPTEPPSFATQVDVGTDGERKVLYALVPARAVHDKRIRGSTLAVLCCLCTYTSALGIAYPNQARMARDLGMHRTMICKAIRRLRDAGYVRLLVPKGMRLPGTFRRGNRYQVLVHGNEALPTKETVQTL
jgi:biotin operon repressor